MAANPTAAFLRLVADVEAQVPILEPGFYLDPNATERYRACVTAVEAL